jgi:hypothetical protein
MGVEKPEKKKHLWDFDVLRGRTFIYFCLFIYLLIYTLFNNAFSNSNNTVPNGL